MIKLYKTSERYAEALQLYPYVFSIRNHTYFFTKEEWTSIPFTNAQPSFNPETEDLVVEEYEEDNYIKRRWIITVKEVE